MSLAMVVDDSEDIAAMVATALRLDGFEVKTWTAEFQALLAPAPWRGVNVAVVDLNLPGIEGTEILRCLRAEHPHVRRVLYSGTDPQWLPGGLALYGVADAVVLKGVDVHKLVEAAHG